MTEASASLSEQATRLRTSFDRAFAVPLRTDAATAVDLLAIRVGAEPYAIRLSEIAGLFIDRRITRVPAGNASLLGIAGFRGVVMPVHSLPTLLGHSARQTPRWLVIAAAAPVALAFDLFESHLRVAADAIVPQQAQSQACAPHLVRSASIVRPVLHLAALLAALDAAGSKQAAFNGKGEKI